MNEIRELLCQLIGNTTVFPSYAAEVLGVDEDARTCKVRVISSGLEIEAVAIQATTTSGGIYAKPVTGSIVIVTFLNPASVFVSLMSDIENVTLIGELGEGVPIASSITERLNLLEKAFNDLLNEYKAHNHQHPQGPTTAFIVPSKLTELEKTKSGDIENKKIIQ